MTTAVAGQSVRLTLPDGSTREYAAGVTGADVALSIGRRLAHDALAIWVDGKVRDLSAPIQGDAPIRILTFDSPEGKQVFWHSSAHVMAQAVTEILPGTKLAIGPPIDEGFYYDFDPPRPFQPEDLARFEERMTQIVAEDAKFSRRECDPQEADRIFTERGEKYKLEILERVNAAHDQVSLYTHSRFLDLCRGPHIPSTGKIKSFKLLSIAGAYWRDAEGNPQLQRIYGVSYPDKKQLDEFLNRREEADKRDHRRLGKQLKLYSINEQSGAGLVLWHPKGAFIRRRIEEFWYRRHQESGYELVYSPHIARLRLWETSGHTGFYSDNMFPPFEVENNPHQLKPMNCPFHILIYQSELRSYRDLPLRWAELGTVYRFERGGVLHGLLRVRGFTQDDAHLFCRRDQVEAEIRRTLDFCLSIYSAFGFDDIQVFLSTRPEKAIGDPADWALAEESLRNALDSRKQKYTVDAGGGAFYGPKIDLLVRDAIGRPWQCGTIQFDFNLPERFDLNYIGADGHAHRPVVIHRALLGSLERFFGVLIEHYAGVFPIWLAPEQALVLSVSDKVADYAASVAVELTALGVRARADLRPEKIGLKIRDAEIQKVPFMLIVGEREAEAHTMSVRGHGGQDQGSQSVTQFAQTIRSQDHPSGSDTGAGAGHSQPINAGFSPGR
ncbi:MAG: threonine--tRNA ligase [candidate division Zixibacteria bacterium]|nr:threonine--tRNA ligase [candidate division Zixibacteria bacterium]